MVYTGRRVVIQWRGSGGLLARRMNDEREKKNSFFPFYFGGGLFAHVATHQPTESQTRGGKKKQVRDFS